MPLPFNTALKVGKIYMLLSHLEEQRSGPVFRWELYLPLALNEGCIYHLRDSTGDFESYLCKDLTAKSSVFRALEIGKLNMESEKGISDCLMQVRENYKPKTNQEAMNDQDWMARAMYELHREGMVELPREELARSGGENLIARRIKEIEIEANQLAIWETKRRSFPQSVIDGQGLVFANGWWARPEENKEESDTLRF